MYLCGSWPRIPFRIFKPCFRLVDVRYDSLKSRFAEFSFAGCKSFCMKCVGPEVVFMWCLDWMYVFHGVMRLVLLDC